MTPIVDARWVYTYVPDMTIGGGDTIYGNQGEDVLVGGAAGDRIDGGSSDDLIFGDAVRLFRRDITPGPVNPAQISNPRFQELTGTQIYPSTGDPSDALLANNSGVWQNYRDPDGAYAPDWAEYLITNLYHSTDATVARPAAGAATHRGRRAVRRDLRPARRRHDPGRRLDRLRGCRLHGVGSAWNTASDFSIATCPSVDGSGDGADYIEGNGGNDVIFGNQGQDDIVGGSSDLFTLDTAAKRTDAGGRDIIYGGSGTAAGARRGRRRVGERPCE